MHQKSTVLTKPGIQRARDHISALISTTQLPKGRLPSLAVLAARADVSRNTMWKAAGELKRQGVLRSVAGGGLWLAGAATNQAVPANRMLEEKRSLISRDIIHGRIAENGVFPSIKEIRERYGICFTTAKKIFRAFIDDGVVIPFKRSYRLVTVRSHRFRSTIVLVQEAVPCHTVAEERAYLILNTVEADCAQLGLKLKLRAIDMQNQDSAGTTIKSLKGDNTIIGCLFDAWYMGETERLKSIASVAHELGGLGLPIAMLDHVCELPGPAKETSGICQVFRPASLSAGRTMGNLLLTLGHKKIAYISLYHQYAWSNLRLAGLIETFQKAGLDNKVAQCTPKEFFYLPLLSDWDDRSFEQVWRPGHSKSEFEALVRQRTTAKKDLQLPAMNSKETRGIHEDILFLKQILKLKPGMETFLRIRHAIFSGIQEKLETAYRYGLVRGILESGDTTAVVCGSDTMAMSALDYLKKQNIKVPGTISLAGFDNTVKAQAQSLTSYDFNLAALVHRMVRHVLHPNAWPRPEGGQAMEVEGLLIERGSTGPASGNN